VLQVAAVAALSVGLFAVPASAANPPATKAAKATTTTSSTLTALHQAKTLLDTAIHDYDGHRAKAVEEVHHAIKELSPHHNGVGHKGAKTAAAATGAKQTTTPGETQQQSDAQLKQALEILSGLHQNQGNAKVGTHLTNAITELNTALKIK
jgi:hypothetical protein